MFIRERNGRYFVIAEWFGTEQIMFAGSLGECIDWTNAHTELGSAF